MSQSSLRIRIVAISLATLLPNVAWSSVNLIHVGPYDSFNLVQQINLAKAIPLAFLHVPKCGSSFTNVFLNTPGICEDWVGEHISVNEQTEERLDVASKDDQQEASNELAATYCPNLYNPFRGHAGIAAEYEEHFKGHGVIMLRQPEQRLISGYNHGQHSWPYWPTPPASLREYAETVAGCATRMLTRGDETSSPCGGPEPSTDEEAALAVHRLREGFVFVGLTDSWDISICLYHKMFGGECAEAEFQNSRPGENRTEGEGYDTSPLGGFVDVHDGLVYEEASRIFQSNLASYGVNHESCRWCFAQGRS